MDKNKSHRIEWWMYIVVVGGIFAICVILHYIVKKFNEARFDERFLRIYNKASASTQVQGTLLEIEQHSKLKDSKKRNIGQEGISLIFSKEANRIKSNTLSKNESLEELYKEFFKKKGIAINKKVDALTISCDSKSHNSNSEIAIDNSVAISKILSTPSKLNISTDQKRVLSAPEDTNIDSTKIDNAELNKEVEEITSFNSIYSKFLGTTYRKDDCTDKNQVLNEDQIVEEEYKKHSLPCDLFPGIPSHNSHILTKNKGNTHIIDSKVVFIDEVRTSVIDENKNRDICPSESISKLNDIYHTSNSKERIPSIRMNYPSGHSDSTLQYKDDMIGETNAIHRGGLKKADSEGYSMVNLVVGHSNPNRDYDLILKSSTNTLLNTDDAIFNIKLNVSKVYFKLQPESVVGVKENCVADSERNHDLYLNLNESQSIDEPLHREVVKYTPSKVTFVNEMPSTSKNRNVESDNNKKESR